MALNKTQSRLSELGEDFLIYQDPYNGAPDNETVVIECGRCGGSGFLPHYSHIHGGVCYQCDGVEGRKSYRVTLKEMRTKERNRINRLNLVALKVAEKRAEANRLIVEFNKENPGIADFLKSESDKRNSFAHSLYLQLEKNGTLSDKQIAVVREMIENSEKIESEKASAESVFSGRGTVTGVIVSTKSIETHFGVSDSIAHKMVVKDDRGFSVYGTIPASIGNGLGSDWLNTLKGMRVTFTATLTPSDDDDKFGFFSRPTKASQL